MQRKKINPARKGSLEQQAYVALVSAADCARTVAEDTFRPYGITGQQYNVLRILRGAGPEGLPTLTVADRMIERTPGMTRMIDRLEAKGLAQRERRSKDRRCVHCYITDKGLELLKKLDRPVEETNQSLFASLKPSEQKQIVRLLTTVQESIKVK